MLREEALIILEVMAAGADSREEALGMVERMRNPKSFLTEGPEVEQAQLNTLRKFGNLLNRYGTVVHKEVGKLEQLFRGNNSGDFLSFSKEINLPHVNNGIYPAVITVENNPRKVDSGQRPNWRDGELLSITIRSKEFSKDQDNYTYEIIIDGKNGGVAYINGGGSAPLDLGDYEILGYLFEDIER